VRSITRFASNNGEGVAKNVVEAAQYYKMAADQGNAVAQYSYAVYLEKVEGVPKNVAEAARCFKMAADQGDTNAQQGYLRCSSRHS
jgi:TPR repeat protein